MIEVMGRRLRRVVLTETVLTGLLFGRCRLELPADARVVRAGHDWTADAVYAIVESNVYEPVVEGCVIPLDTAVRVHWAARPPSETAILPSETVIMTEWGDPSDSPRLGWGD